MPVKIVPAETRAWVQRILNDPNLECHIALESTRTLRKQIEGHFPTGRFIVTLIGSPDAKQDSAT